MASFTLTAQNVNGDPMTSGAQINIINSGFTTLTFVDQDNRLGPAQPGETVSFDGGKTLLSYRFLGYGNVRGDAQQHAGFVRVEMGGGTFRTFAIDMNADGDGVPDLKNGNTQLTVAQLKTGPGQEWPVPVCFAQGAPILTPQGRRPVETLRAGDAVLTLDSGVQRLIWVGSARFPARGPAAPVRFETGALGNDAPLVVSQQHRMLVGGWRAELVCGAFEVLVAARHLVNGRDIRIVEGGWIEYHHLLFDRHELVWAAGIPSESFLPAFAAGTGLDPTRTGAAPASRLCRPQARRAEALALAG